jgi:outer membrane biogenesis lipoprotein LolB
MTYLLIRSLLAFLFLLITGGCTHRPTLVEPSQPVSVIDWLPVLQERGEHWISYQARVQFKVQTSEKKVSLNALVLARMPDQLRLEIFRMGQTVGVLTLNKDQSSLFVPSERAIYIADRSEQLMDHFFGVVLPLDTLGYSLSGSLPQDQLEGLQIVRHDPEWVGYAKPSPAGWSYAWHFLSSPQKIASVSAKRGASTYTIRYDPAVGLAAKDVPQKITFTSAQGQIELTVQEITPAPVLQDSVFSNNFAGELRTIDLGRPISENP